MNITISAFFSGTKFKISDSNTVASQLYKAIKSSNNQIAMGFDGCGIRYGLRGSLFGAGLDKQCQEIIKRIEVEIKKGNTITLNAYGFRRGGIGALMLAKQLGNVDPSLLKINLALLDPVPGNLIATSTLDPFDFSLAKKVMDLSDCKPLQNVLALYTHEPLPALAAHAPLFSIYPSTTKKEEDVIEGCHAEAEDLKVNGSLTFARVLKFFQENGSDFNDLPEQLQSLTDDKAVISFYERALKSAKKNKSRATHSTKKIQINTKAQAEYFNLHHQVLAGVKQPNKNHALATIESKYTVTEKLNQLTTRYPKTWVALKITLLSVILASLVLLIGIIGAMPILVGTPASVVILGLMLTIPVAAIVVPALSTIALPLSKWILNRIFYSQFHMREIHPEKPTIKESSQKVLEHLNDKGRDKSKEPIESVLSSDTVNFNLFEKKCSLRKIDEAELRNKSKNFR